MLSLTMLPSAPSRIFISYARKDGAALAQRLQSDLKSSGFDAWLDTQRLRGGATWTREIETALDQAQYVLVLLTYGSYISEICRSEQLRALRKGTCVIPVKAQSDSDIPLHLEAKNYRDFSDPTDYDAQFKVLLGDIHGNVSAILPERYHETPVRYLTAPPRVANYLQRPEALRALRDTLFSEDHRQPIALTALAGMGGIGKTVLAKALTDDHVVRRAFPDGIVWITAGKERKRDFIEEMREVAKALGDDLSAYDTAVACENRYRTAIASKAALIVVDDVWSKNDIEPLLAESPRSRFLFTTRDATIGRFVSAREHRASLLDLKQSRELLASWANVPAEELPAPADDVIAECGCLPLALSVVGALLRDTDEQFWIDTLDLLRKASLSAIEDQLPDGQQSFFKAVEVSFQSLKPELQECYKALAVLLEDMPAPLPILQTLWNASRAEAARVSRLFVARSLAQLDDSSNGIRLHDLQLDYVRAQFPDQEALNLIRGAIRLSSHIIDKDPAQFASQLVGRLLPHQNLLAITQFAERIASGAPKPWLRPVKSTLHPPGTSLVRTLGGHTQWVNGVAMSENGRLAVSASGDEMLKVWDVRTGRELRTLEGHTGGVNSVAVSTDGRLAVSASEDKTLKVWDVETGRELRTLRGHTGNVDSVAVSVDGGLAVSASWDKTLKVWDVETGCELRILKGHTQWVKGVAMSASGRLAVSASSDNTLKVWNVKTGRKLRTLEGHKGGVNSVALSTDGRLAVSASMDKTLKVWDTETGRELRTLRGHASSVRYVAVSADGRLAVSASEDKTLKVWDVETGGEVRTLKGHTDEVRAVAVRADGGLAVSASCDKMLKVWDLESGELHTLQGHLESVHDVSVSADRWTAVSASYDKTLKVWDVGTGRELLRLEGHTRWVNGVAVSADGRLAVSASDDKTLKVWDVKMGIELRTLRGHTDCVQGVAVSADGRLAVSACNDTSLKVWDVETGRELRSLQGHTVWVSDVALSADGRLAVSASGDKTLKVWDVKTGQELHTLQGHANSVQGVAVSADGRLAVSASADKTLKVWDVETGRELRTLEGHKRWVSDVALSVNGRRAVSASGDNTLKLWDVDTGALIATFTCDAVALCCALITDDQFVVGDMGGYVHFLRLEQPYCKN